jgi:hypothetical protein
MLLTRTNLHAFYYTQLSCTSSSRPPCSLEDLSNRASINFVGPVQDLAGRELDQLYVRSGTPARFGECRGRPLLELLFDSQGSGCRLSDPMRQQVLGTSFQAVSSFLSHFLKGFVLLLHVVGHVVGATPKKLTPFFAGCKEWVTYCRTP